MRARLKDALVPAVGIIVVACSVGCSEDSPTEAPEVDLSEYLSGGETTIFNATNQAYTFPAPNVSDLDRHLDGDLAFESAFVGAGAPVNPGLGPVFNNNACTACHVNNGRGRPFLGTEPSSLLLRASVPGKDEHGGPVPAPGFGLQLSDKSLFGVQPEVRVRVTYEQIVEEFDDGESYTLHRPSYALEDAYTDLPADIMTSPRIALPVFGRGLLEAIPEEDILAMADEADADGDGISGRPNWVYDVRNQTMELGRFGWKANQPTLVQQAAAAYRNDMGVTNPIFPTDSAIGQPQADGVADDPEIDMETVELAAFYTQTLAVPARRNVEDPVVRRGQQLFKEAQCATCHTPSLETGHLEGIPSVSHQTIRPYTDMLLHDMGPDLADGRPDYEATGSEWRTTPLWGLGLTRTVQNEYNLLHDGRAKSILEAVMWHGGEAEDSREAVRSMSAGDRAALLAFLESL